MVKLDNARTAYGMLSPCYPSIYRIFMMAETLSVRIPPLDGVQSLRSLLSPVSSVRNEMHSLPDPVSRQAVRKVVDMVKIGSSPGFPKYFSQSETVFYFPQKSYT